MPSGHEKFHYDQVTVTLWMFPGLSVRKSGPAAWQVSYAISLRYQSKPGVTTVWLKWPIRFYSGKDLCTEGEIQMLLYSTRAALPTLPIDGCHKGLTLHHPLKPRHSCNSGDKCNCQNIIFSVHVRATEQFLC